MNSKEKYSICNLVYYNPELTSQIQGQMQAQIESLKEAGLLIKDEDKLRLTNDGLNFIDNHIDVIHVNFVKLILRIIKSSHEKYKVLLSKCITFLYKVYEKQPKAKQEQFIKSLLHNCSLKSLMLLQKYIPVVITEKNRDYRETEAEE